MEAITVDPLVEFFEAIRSTLTKDRYERRLDLFLCGRKLDSILGPLIVSSPDQFQDYCGDVIFRDKELARMNMKNDSGLSKSRRNTLAEMGAESQRFFNAGCTIFLGS
ncbi:MAG: hypothetical protein JRN52_09515 [Nitrososphaerota archaeon]|nr:hypothetical protein [Nitrososphaerota archaeon]